MNKERPYKWVRGNILQIIKQNNIECKGTMKIKSSISHKKSKEREKSNSVFDSINNSRSIIIVQKEEAVQNSKLNCDKPA